MRTVDEKRNHDGLLQQANQRLKSAGSRVSIALKKKSLYLRATLPPKPGSAKDSSHSQWIAVGVYCNPAGIKKAEVKAQELAADLFYERFDWEAWGGSQKSPKDKVKAIADWVKEFEQDYFRRRGRTPKTLTTWDKDYRLPYSRLPQHRALTAEILIETATTLWEPNTRSRQRACTCFGKLAEFASVAVSMSEYRGSYSPTAVNPRDLPSDETIVKLWESEKNEGWRNAIALMATYGLRPHEIVHLEHGTTLMDSPGVCTVLEDTKTGWRQVWPEPAEWWELFQLNKPLVLPNITAKTNREYGIRIAQWFNRHNYGIVPYDLRHAWAARTAVNGLDSAIAAKMMGHSLMVHNRVYHRFINKANLQAAWERSQK